MNKNIRIAKDLVKIARELIADQKTAKWNWKHPFTFDEYNQDVNQLAQLISSGKLKMILVNIYDMQHDLTQLESDNIYVQIVSPGMKIDKKDFKKDYYDCFSYHYFNKRPSKVRGMKVIYAVTDSGLRNVLDGCASKRDLESYINIAEGEGDNYLDKLSTLFK